jgi:Mrp family chromosome partitioning ATPase
VPAANQHQPTIAALPGPRPRLPLTTVDIAPPGGGLAPELIEACRSVSLHLGGPHLRALGVTSSIRGEGRSTIAHALAHIQSTDYQRRVVLLDLDLEKPDLASRVGAAPAPGVVELAGGDASLDDVLQPLAGRITVVAAGAPEGSLARAMATVLRSEALKLIASGFDVIIADLPPLLVPSFGLAPAAAFSELLLVVRGGVTPLARIRQATAHLPVEPKVLLNGTRSPLPAWVRRFAGC